MSLAHQETRSSSSATSTAMRWDAGRICQLARKVVVTEAMLQNIVLDMMAKMTTITQTLDHTLANAAVTSANVANVAASASAGLGMCGRARAGAHAQRRGVCGPRADRRARTSGTDA